ISQIQGADPSIAIDSDSTVYYAYVNNEPVAAGNPPEGHARVKVGHRNPDNSVTWTNDFDIGASHGIKNDAEIEPAGGSSGRAAGTAANAFVAFVRVARQSGGKGLFASFDTTEPVAPKPPCLSGTRDPAASHLTWKAPDNGGSDIVNYQILRGTSPGGELLLGQTDKTTFDDTTADPAVSHYYYVVTAINAVGASAQSNEVDLTVVVPPPPENVCALPGLT